MLLDAPALPETKRCPSCTEVKPRSAFRKGGRHMNRLASYCTPCAIVYNTARKYGLSHGDYLAMFEAQGGRCAICQGDASGQRLHIDHCHDTGRVRGLLCRPCNVALGFMQDDPDRLVAAAAYLRRV